MTKWRRPIRMTIGMGLAWGAAWSLAAFVVARIPGFDSDLPFAFLFVPAGVAGGLLFSAVLLLYERPRGIEVTSRSVPAACAAVCGLLLAWIFVALRGNLHEYLVFGPVLALASAAAAGGWLAIARPTNNKENDEAAAGPDN